jgi:hypothetical protein
MCRGNGPYAVRGPCDPAPRDGAERITGETKEEKGDNLMTPGRTKSANSARREGR